MSLNVDPGGFRSPAIARLTSGFAALLRAGVVGAERRSSRGRRSRSGRTRASRPSRAPCRSSGSIATTAPRWFPSASYAAFCTFGSMVSCTEAPFGSWPVTMFCSRSRTWLDAVPASCAFSAPSMPVGRADRVVVAGDGRVELAVGYWRSNWYVSSDFGEVTIALPSAVRIWPRWICVLVGARPLVPGVGLEVVGLEHLDDRRRDEQRREHQRARAR